MYLLIFQKNVNILHFSNYMCTIKRLIYIIQYIPCSRTFQPAGFLPPSVPRRALSSGRVTVTLPLLGFKIPRGPPPGFTPQTLHDMD
jgi:hypothetical protein